MGLTEQAEAIAELYAPNQTGAPSKLGSAETLADFLQAIAQGNYLSTACALAGLSESSVYRYLKQAETDPGNHAALAFRRSYEKACAQAEAIDVANVRRAGRLPQFWAASMTYLERRFPDRWSRRTDAESGPKVVVQIGATAEHVQIIANQVNGIRNYQTSILPDSAETLTNSTNSVTQSIAKDEGESG